MYSKLNFLKLQDWIVVYFIYLSKVGSLSSHLHSMCVRTSITFGIVLPLSHIKIFIILIKLIFQNMFFNKNCSIFLIFFGDVATFAVEVWSWKLWQIKDPLAFGSSTAVPRIKTSYCIESPNHRARRLVQARRFVLFCCAMICFT